MFVGNLHRKVISSFFTLILLSAVAIPCRADGTEVKKNDMRIFVRARAGLNVQGSEPVLKCDYLRLEIVGTFAHDFHYRFRQRFDKAITADNWLAATDYLYIGWKKNGWGISAGKNYVGCGGFEYQASSYDIYIRPGFFSGLGGMYNYVVNGSMDFCGETFTIQFGSSLYSKTPSKLVGYSVLLKGQQGPWEHAWSVNLFERPTNDSGRESTGLYNFYVCLGNRFHIKGSTIDLGLVHRLDVCAPTFFKDFSLVGKFKIPVHCSVDIFGKATWDYKESGIQDPMLADGTNMWQAGFGVEFYPVRSSRNLRLHCVYYNQNGSINCTMAGLSVTLDIKKILRDDS